MKTLKNTCQQTQQQDKTFNRPTVNNSANILGGQRPHLLYHFAEQILVLPQSQKTIWWGGGRVFDLLRSPDNLKAPTSADCRRVVLI